MDRTAAEKKFVASRPAAGGESCIAGFYFHFIGNFTALSWNKKRIKNIKFPKNEKFCSGNLLDLLFSFLGKFNIITQESKKAVSRGI